MRFTRALRGAGWGDVPPEKFPSPKFWNKAMVGTPFADAQTHLHKHGLHSPWMRNYIYRYDHHMRNPYTLATAFRPETIKLAMALGVGLWVVEEVLGIKIFQDGAFTTDGKDVQPGAMNGETNNMNLTPVRGDEHVANYRGVNAYNNRYAFETSQTKGQ